MDEHLSSQVQCEDGLDPGQYLATMIMDEAFDFSHKERSKFYFDVFGQKGKFIVEWLYVKHGLKQL